MELKTTHPISIVAYKHNGDFHRLWRKGVVLDTSDDRYIIMNNKTLVEESSGKSWYTREPAICIFYTKRWFNVICMLKKTGVHFYCNLASPVIQEQNTLKYIDYDLDLKVFPNSKIKLLDSSEYSKHKDEFGYSKDIEKIIQWELSNLKEMIEKKQDPFNDEFIIKWKHVFEENQKK